MMSRRVGPSEQGQLQGANQSMAGLASMIGPSLFGLSFAWAVRHPTAHIPGVGMFEAAMAMAGCLVLASLQRPQVPASVPVEAAP